MTRSSTKELFTPLDNPKRVFRSKRRLFKTPSLVESNSPKFDLFSDIEECSEEGTEEMTETIEQYMSKTREDYGSGVTRPKINIDTHFELKGQFLKELCDNTFSGSEHEDANEHIEKVWRLNLTRAFFRAWERSKELLMKCPQHYLTDMQEVILVYNGLDVPTRQILNSKDWTNEQSLARKRIRKSAQLNGKESNGPFQSISTAKADSTGIRRIGSGLYVTSDSQISNIFFETVPFPGRLHDYCCDEWKEARELEILETYLIGTTLHDNTLPQKEKDP
ncbi:hypothetical protein Tco_0909535 [Tanacetum coccineum]|uniref:Uncharacterized protein n=1 Tax=Tanacetum coccineum TaxID=301880 RepID=A0ABQ5CRI5_9ASTR